MEEKSEEGGIEGGAGILVKRARIYIYSLVVSVIGRVFYPY